METRAGDPGAFARFDLTRVPSPAFVVDVAKVEANCRVLADVGARGGAKVLLALKAFSLWRLGEVTGRHLDGTATSGLWEARLAAEHYRGEVASYCAAYRSDDEVEEVARLSDHVIFNTPGQHDRFRPALERARAAGAAFDVGLRINPGYSTGEVPRYDPAAPGSRLGFPVEQLRAEHLDGVNGLHVHSLCEQDFPPLKATWTHLEPLVAPFFKLLNWLNIGGGHHITRADYQRADLEAFLRDLRERSGCQLYLEPGEAVALDAGILIGTVLDLFDNAGPQAITDISATCHMPDVIEAPYRPAMLNDGDGPAVRLGGPSCLAGDVIGDYALPDPHVGQRFAFLDQAHYSMVKTTTFNGVPLPSIWLWDSRTDALEEVRSFDWTTFRDRLS